MDILVKLTVPNHIYQFYRQASAYVANHTAEDIMSDALTAYAGLISRDTVQQQEPASSDCTE